MLDQAVSINPSSEETEEQFQVDVSRKTLFFKLLGYSFWGCRR